LTNWLRPRCSEAKQEDNFSSGKGKPPEWRDLPPPISLQVVWILPRAWWKNNAARFIWRKKNEKMRKGRRVKSSNYLLLVVLHSHTIRARRPAKHRESTVKEHRHVRNLFQLNLFIDHILQKKGFFKNGQTDRQTDGRTDGQTLWYSSSSPSTHCPNSEQDVSKLWAKPYTEKSISFGCRQFWGKKIKNGNKFSDGFSIFSSIKKTSEKSKFQRKNISIPVRLYHPEFWVCVSLVRLFELFNISFFQEETRIFSSNFGKNWQNRDRWVRPTAMM
jgi:hypothetical protein